MDRIIYNRISCIQNQTHPSFFQELINYIFHGNGHKSLYDILSITKPIFFQYLMEQMGKGWKRISIGSLINNQSQILLTACVIYQKLTTDWTWLYIIWYIISKINLIKSFPIAYAAHISRKRDCKRIYLAGYISTINHGTDFTNISWTNRTGMYSTIYTSIIKIITHIL